MNGTSPLEWDFPNSLLQKKTLYMGLPDSLLSLVPGTGEGRAGQESGRMGRGERQTA